MGFFDGIASAALGGVSSLVGGILTNNSQKDIANDANQQAANIAASNNTFNASEAEKNRAFQKETRANQYQTAVGDLQAAGLNPMLAYTQGGAGNLSGATATSSGNPQIQQAQLHNPAAGFAQSAAQMANIKADLQLKDTQATKNIADTTAAEQSAKLIDAQTASEILRMPGISEQIKKITAETILLERQKELVSAQTGKSAMETMLMKTGDLPEATSKGIYYKNSPYNPFTFKDVIQGGNAAASIAKSLNPLKR